MDSVVVHKKMRQKQVALRKRTVHIHPTTAYSNTDTSDTYVEDTPPDQRLLRKRGRPKKLFNNDPSLSTDTDKHTGNSECTVQMKERLRKNKGKLVEHLSVNESWGEAHKTRKRGLRLSKKNTIQQTKASPRVTKGVLDQVIEAQTADNSGDELKPKNDFDLLDIENGMTYFRCNLKTAVRDLRTLPFKEEHLSAIKQTPFWVLFNSILTGDIKKMRRRCQKYEEDIRSVMKTYDTRSKKFIIAGHFLEITKMDIQLILGVTGGTIRVPLTKKNYPIPDWTRRCFETTEENTIVLGKKQMYKCFILRRLREIVLINNDEGYKDTARLVHCYLLAMFLAPTRNCSINWHVTGYCVNLESIYTYDWCGFIWDQLMSQIQRTRNLMSGGCTMLLVYWLCERTRLIEACEDMTIPRCMRWDLKELNERLGAQNISKLRTKYLRNEQLLPTNQEKEEYRRLKILWDRQLSLAKSSDQWIPDDIFVTPDVDDSSASKSDDSQYDDRRKRRGRPRKSDNSTSSPKKLSYNKKGAKKTASATTAKEQRNPFLGSRRPRFKRTSRDQRAAHVGLQNTEMNQSLRSTRSTNSPLDTQEAGAPSVMRKLTKKTAHRTSQPLGSKGHRAERSPTIEHDEVLDSPVFDHSPALTPTNTLQTPFRTPSSCRVTRSRALQIYPDQALQRQSLSPETISPTRRTGKTIEASRKLQNDLGLISTGETAGNQSACSGNVHPTIVQKESTPAKAQSTGGEKTQNPKGDHLDSAGNHNTVSRLEPVARIVFPSQPSFSIGMTQDNKTQEVDEDVNMEVLLHDINKAARLVTDNEPDYISREKACENDGEIAGTQIGKMFDGCSDLLKETGKNCSTCIDVEKIKSELEGKDSEIASLREQLQISNKRIIAMEKMHEVNVQRKVQTAIAETKSKHKELFETAIQFLNDTITDLMEENDRLRKFEQLNQNLSAQIDKLTKENEELSNRLKAELEPTETQLMQKETTIQLFDTIIDKENVKNSYGKLVEVHEEMAEELRLLKDKKQATTPASVPGCSATVKNSSAEKTDQVLLQQGLVEYTSLDPSKLMNADSHIATVIGVLSAGGGGMPSLKSKKQNFVKGTLCVDLENFNVPAEENTDAVAMTTLITTDQNVVYKGRKRRATTPNTMIRTVKSRTLNDDRQKPSSDQMEQPEHIDVDINDPDKLSSDITRATCNSVLPLKKKKGAVRIIKDEVRKYLEEIWSKDGEWATVWSGRPRSRLDVGIKDILMVLHDERISSDVVDCWGYLLLSKFSSSTDTLVFLTASWDYISQYKGGDRPKSLVKVVDKRIEKEVGEDHVLLFPMLTKGKGRHEQGDHWTLLQLDLGECEWKFYNSLEPRSKKQQDVHFSRSLILVDYIEQKIREVFKIKHPRHPIHQNTIKTPFPIYGPQQSHGSLDCGVVLCSNLENLITRTSITKYRLKHAEAVIYRSKIVEWFVKESKAV